MWNIGNTNCKLNLFPVRVRDFIQKHRTQSFHNSSSFFLSSRKGRGGWFRASEGLLSIINIPDSLLLHVLHPKGGTFALSVTGRALRLRALQLHSRCGEEVGAMVKIHLNLNLIIWKTILPWKL